MMKPNRYGSLRRILLCIGMAIGSTLMPAAVVQAGTVNSLTVTSNGPWSVGQNNAQYTITLAHTRGGNNTVTLNDQLPAGLWPTWSGTRTNTSSDCGRCSRRCAGCRSRGLDPGHGAGRRLGSSQRSVSSGHWNPGGPVHFPKRSAG